MNETYKIKIVTPTRVIEKDNVKSIVIKTDQGESEILPFHSEYLANIEISILTINYVDLTKHFIVGGGAIHFKNEENECVLILNSIKQVEDINLEKINKKEIEATLKLENSKSTIEHHQAELKLKKYLLEKEAKKIFKE